jgi:hypothetical protein
LKTAKKVMDLTSSPVFNGAFIKQKKQGWVCSFPPDINNSENP